MLALRTRPSFGSLFARVSSALEFNDWFDLVASELCVGDDGVDVVDDEDVDGDDDVVDEDEDDFDDEDDGSSTVPEPFLGAAALVATVLTETASTLVATALTFLAAALAAAALAAAALTLLAAVLTLLAAALTAAAFDAFGASCAFGVFGFFGVFAFFVVFGLSVADPRRITSSAASFNQSVTLKSTKYGMRTSNNGMDLSTFSQEKFSVCK